MFSRVPTSERCRVVGAFRIATTMIYTHILKLGGASVLSPVASLRVVVPPHSGLWWPAGYGRKQSKRLTIDNRTLSIVSRRPFATIPR
jgi:hypothetical protein